MAGYCPGVSVLRTICTPVSTRAALSALLAGCASTAKTSTAAASTPAPNTRRGALPMGSIVTRPSAESASKTAQSCQDCTMPESAAAWESMATPNTATSTAPAALTARAKR